MIYYLGFLTLAVLILGVAFYLELRSRPGAESSLCTVVALTLLSRAARLEKRRITATANPCGKVCAVSSSETEHLTVTLS